MIQTNCKHFYSFLGPYINSCSLLPRRVSRSPSHGSPCGTGARRPCVVPGAGAVVRVGPLDSDQTPARRLLELGAAVRPRSSAAGAWARLGPAAPACSRRLPARDTARRGPGPFAALRSLKLGTGCAARGPEAWACSAGIAPKQPEASDLRRGRSGTRAMDSDRVPGWPGPSARSRGCRSSASV